MSNPDPAKTVKPEDNQLWLAYADQVQKILAPQGLGAKGAIYTTLMGIQGIPAGELIPQSITNEGIFSVANNLLDPDTPVFEPGGGSYFEYVNTFVSSVKIKRDLSPGAKQNLALAENDLQKAEASLAQATKEALATYNDDVKNGIFVGTFQDYIDHGNARSYTAAQKTRDDKFESLVQVKGDVFGRDAARLTKAQDALDKAQVTDVLKPGYNMPCSPAQVRIGSSTQADPLGMKPAYTIDADYAAQVDGWIQNFNINNTSLTFKFNLRDAQRSSWENHGFSETKANVSASIGWFIRANFEFDTVNKTDHISAADAASDITITISCRGSGIFSFHPSDWNVDTSAFKLGEDPTAPILTNQAVVVNQALLAYGVGMDIDLGEHLFTKVQDMVHTATTMGGGASIWFFGLSIGGGASSSVSNDTSFSDIKFDEKNFRISIPPSQSGFPTLLAVLGRKLDKPVV